MYQSQHNNTGIKQREIICPAPAVTRHKEESKRVNDRLAHLQLSDPHDGTVDWMMSLGNENIVEKGWDHAGDLVLCFPPPPTAPPPPQYSPIWTYTHAHVDMHTDAWIYTHAHMCTHPHTHVHTLSYTCMHTYMHTHTRTHARTHTQTHMYTHACKHTHTHARSHTHTHIHIHTHMHTHTHAHTHIHTHTHTHTQLSSSCPESSFIQYQWGTWFR